jgi:hypothetical protein
VKQDKQANVVAVETKIPMKGQLKPLDSTKEPSVENQSLENIETVIQKNQKSLLNNRKLILSSSPHPCPVLISPGMPGYQTVSTSTGLDC